MRHGKRFNKLGRPASHRRAMLRNMVTSLFAHREIKTTLAKAKEARKVAERLIRYAVSSTLADKRRIISFLMDRKVAHELIRLGKNEFSNRPAGGYVAIYRLGYRKGDGAEMALLKLLVEEREKKKRKRKRKKAPEQVEVIERAEEKAPVETPVEVEDTLGAEAEEIDVSTEAEAKEQEEIQQETEAEPPQGTAETEAELKSTAENTSETEQKEEQENTTDEPEDDRTQGNSQSA